MDQLLQILRDPIWQFAGAVVGAVALGLSVFLFAIDRRQQRKELSLQILANVSLFQASPEVRKKLKVFYAERKVSDLSLIQYKILNTGQVPVEPTDYIEPIRVHLSPTASIIEIETTSSYPPNLGMSMTQIGQSTIELTKSLLNPGEYAVGKIIASNNDGTIRTEARIVGISFIKTVSDATLATLFSSSPIIGFGLAAVVLTGIATIILGAIFNFNSTIGWLCAVNIVTFAFFSLDKMLALIHTSLRIPEIVLLMLSTLGGSLGALLGMYTLRHKTRKGSFLIAVWLILIAQIILWIVLIIMR